MERTRICMICGTHHRVLREGGVALCSRCLTALADALGEKLSHSAPQEKADARRPLVP